MGKYDKGYAHPFTATAADIGMTYHAVAGKPEGEPPNPFDFIYSPWWIPLFILDLPFSVVADVVMLPYDLYHIRDVGRPRGTGREEATTLPTTDATHIGDPLGGSPAGSP